MYAFSPSPLIPKVLSKLKDFREEVMFIPPLGPHRAWFSLLLDRLSQAPTPIPVTPDLLRQPLSGILMETGFMPGLQTVWRALKAMGFSSLPADRIIGIRLCQEMAAFCSMVHSK